MFARRPIQSPCVSVCIMNPVTGLCEGCLRTLAEIGGWASLTDAERDAAMRRLASRRTDAADGAAGATSAA